MSDASADALVLISQQGAVRTLTLNRPKALNSFTTALHGELLAALDAAAADAGVRCVVITGAGRGFCAGQDLTDPAIAPRRDAQGQLAAPHEQPDVGDLIEVCYRPLANRIQSMPIPVVAAVNGVAAGAGANLALGCDLVLAARGASFIQAFSKIGLVPDCGGSWLLPRLLSRQRALGLAMLGDKLGAEQALAWGLVWQVVDDAELPAAAQALAERLATLPVKALAATREALDAGARSTLDDALAHEARLQSRLGRSHDYVEGVSAFFDRRPARFTER
jgi:2-(1,2-epoxy-1,2-dihydrophenyl)acetyl-CoA isomerase